MNLLMVKFLQKTQRITIVVLLIILLNKEIWTCTPSPHNLAWRFKGEAK